MPVLDHAVHESTRQGADARWGCWNLDLSDKPYYAPDRVYREDGTFEVIQRPIKTEWLGRMCFGSLTDPKCEGCKHRGAGEAYAETVQKDGK